MTILSFETEDILLTNYWTTVSLCQNRSINYNKGKNMFRIYQKKHRKRSTVKAKIISANFSGSLDYPSGEQPCFAAGMLTLRIINLNSSDFGSNQSLGLVPCYDVDMTKIWEGKIDLNNIKLDGKRVDYAKYRVLLLNTITDVIRKLHSDMHEINETYLTIPINTDRLEPEKILSMCLEKLRKLGYNFTESSLFTNTAPEVIKSLSLFENEKSKLQTWLSDGIRVRPSVK